MPCEVSCSALGGSAEGMAASEPGVPRSGLLRVGTWNVSHWSVERAVVVAQDIAFDVLAVQEMHLAVHPWRELGLKHKPLACSFTTAAPFAPWAPLTMANHVV